MADNTEEMIKNFRASHKTLMEHAQKHLDSASDMLDHIESRLPTIRGENPLPQRRPRAAGQTNDDGTSPLGGQAR